MNKNNDLSEGDDSEDDYINSFVNSIFYICQSMKWKIDYVESLSLSTFNDVLKFLRMSPPLELMVASFLGVKIEDDVKTKNINKNKELKECFKNVNIDNSKITSKFTNKEMVERFKNMIK